MVVIVDHHGVAGAVRHWLGAQGTINVTVQTGERLAAELAGPFLRSDRGEDGQARRPLTPLDEGQAVRRVVDRWLDTVTLRLSPVGRERLYTEVAAAFREKEQMARRGRPRIRKWAPSASTCPACTAISGSC